MSPNPSSNNFFVISEDDSQLLSHLKQNCNPSKLYSESKKLDFTLDTKYYSASVSCSTFDSLRTLAIWRVSNKETPVQSFCYCMKRSQLVFDLTHIDNITKIFDFDTKVPKNGFMIFFSFNETCLVFSLSRATYHLFHNPSQRHFRDGQPNEALKLWTLNQVKTTLNIPKKSMKNMALIELLKFWRVLNGTRSRRNSRSVL